MKKIRSILNCTPHTLAGCMDCGWQGGSSSDAVDARLALFRHMRRENHFKGYLEVGRTSHYQMTDTKNS